MVTEFNKKSQDRQKKGVFDLIEMEKLTLETLGQRAKNR